MTDTENKTAAGSDGVHEFTMQYAGRELATLVEKTGDRLKVMIDNDLVSELELHWDGTLTQISGNALPDSNIEFIKKQVLGQDK